MYSHQGSTQATQKDTYPQVGKSVILETKDWLKLLTTYPQLSYHMENYSRNIPPHPSFIHTMNSCLGKK